MEEGYQFINNIVTLVNDAYSRGEKRMWRSQYVKRTEFGEMKDFMLKDRIIVAYSKAALKGQGGEKKTDGKKKDETDADEIIEESLKCPAGIVYCDVNQDRENEIGELGMLCATEEMTGKGLGNFLIRAAEKRARRYGCRWSRLELLTPRDWEHPVKKILHAWYTRLGYIQGDPEPFEKAYPDKAPDLAYACTFTVYLKGLYDPIDQGRCTANWMQEYRC